VCDARIARQALVAGLIAALAAPPSPVPLLAAFATREPARPAAADDPDAAGARSSAARANSLE
ncbi:hypothetical protein, partial [Burkholderia ubonensis]|uniref:hypothetical protein n=1 Tax=Burkholderia ubonensis TaxID=101571 RepID=UPI001C433262